MCGHRGVSPRWARCSKVVTSGPSCSSAGLPACPSTLSSEDLTPAAVCVQVCAEMQNCGPQTHIRPLRGGCCVLAGFSSSLRGCTERCVQSSFGAVLPAPFR